MAFAPLFWLFDETIPKDEKPTLENFKNCYLNKKTKPGGAEKRLLIELLGGLGVIGGVTLWIYGWFKNSNLWKYLGGGLSLGGLGATVTGIVKYYKLGIGELLKFDPKKADKKDRKQDDLDPTPVQTPPSSPPASSQSSSGPVSVDTRLVIVKKSEDRNGEKSENKQGVENNFGIEEELQVSSARQQALNISTGFVHACAEITSDFLKDHPNLKPFVYMFPGVKELLFIDDVIKKFKEGKSNFEYYDPEDKETRTYTYSNNTERKLNDAYKTLGVNEGSTEEEVKKAYRDAAMKHHPDRNPGDDEAPQKFKNAALAYEVIQNYKGWDKPST